MVRAVSMYIPLALPLHQSTHLHISSHFRVPSPDWSLYDAFNPGIRVLEQLSLMWHTVLELT